MHRSNNYITQNTDGTSNIALHFCHCSLTYEHTKQYLKGLDRQCHGETPVIFKAFP
jgi:hypothetical protein